MDVSRALAHDAPAGDANEMLAFLAQHPNVRGCVTLTSDSRVIWSGGPAFDTEGAAVLEQVVSFVRAVLSVVREHVHNMDHEVRIFSPGRS